MLTTANYRLLRTIIRVSVLLGGLGLILWLVQQDIAFNGAFTTSHDYRSPSPFFTELVPKQRVTLEDEGSRFIDEPVYTTLRYPRPFQELELEVIFENPDDLFVEFGPQVGLPEVYDLKPLNHPLLNQLLDSDDEWDRIDESLYQKRFTDYRYESKDQFITGLPPQQEVGYYGVDWEQPYLPDFEGSLSETDITTPLQGTHEFYVASNQLVFDVSIDYYDINTTQGEDQVSVIIENWQEEEITTCTNADDGEIREKGITSSLQTIRCEVSLDETQVLRLSFQATDDIIINRIQSSAPYFVAKNHLRLAGGNEYVSEFGDENISSVDVTSSARTWSAVTPHRSTLQSIRLSREQIVLDEPFKAETYQMPNNQRFLLQNGYSFITEKGNITITGRGVYALPGTEYFTPEPWLIDATTDPQVIGINYLVTNYTPPTILEEGGMQQIISIDLSKVFAPTKALRFQWSLPKMEEVTTFAVKELNALYTSDPITLDNVQEKFLRFIEREL